MQDKTKNLRRTTWILTGIAVFLLAFLLIAGVLLEQAGTNTDFSRKNLSPSLGMWFGTDWMGRDMFCRTVAGLSLSLRIGILTSVLSAVTSLCLGILAASGEKADAVVSWWIDLVMGIPHILLVMLISLACGRGMAGVVAGVSLSHWPSLARVIRGEVLQLKDAPYILTAEKLGVSRLTIIKKHILPHLFPQFVTGMILLFPHAVLHEASVTFLGFGLGAEQPAIGVILSESIRYLTTGRWWLTVFPGLSLMLMTALFAVLGERWRRLLDPSSAHE